MIVIRRCRETIFGFVPLFSGERNTSEKDMGLRVRDRIPVHPEAVGEFYYTPGDTFSTDKRSRRHKDHVFDQH
jgi:hypothetical protein